VKSLKGKAPLNPHASLVRKKGEKEGDTPITNALASRGHDGERQSRDVGGKMKKGNSIRFSIYLWGGKKEKRIGVFAPPPLVKVHLKIARKCFPRCLGEGTFSVWGKKKKTSKLFQNSH